jgi:hypothetical protein
MEFKPVDLPELIGTLMGVSIPLMAVIGLVLRFAVKPLIEAMAKARPENVTFGNGSEADLARLSRRVLELEQTLGRRHLEPLASIEAPPNENQSIGGLKTRS